MYFYFLYGSARKSMEVEEEASLKVFFVKFEGRVAPVILFLEDLFYYDGFLHLRDLVLRDLVLHFHKI